MSRGRVYLWTDDPARGLYGRLTASVEPLSNLDVDTDEPSRLSGRFVCVRNGGAVYEPDPVTRSARAVPLGDARPDATGDFLFEPGRGGGRIDKVVFSGGSSSQAEYLESGVLFPEAEFRSRYIQASRFGEVNTYFHLDRIAAYVHDLLCELDAPPLPRVTAAVNAHHAATAQDGVRDGVKGRNHWLPFQGGHYRLPSQRYAMTEYNPIATEGEIHLGPGWQLLEHGALVEAVSGRYRANASHNAGIIYHEYGHHITRHTADFRANALRAPGRQDNRKTAMDEGTCDYWAAAMLHTPHIWILHRRHDDQEIHVRSLTSSKSMADFDAGPQVDVHTNGTIWGAALWDLRTQLSATEPDGARRGDLLVLKALLLMGKVVPRCQEASVHNVCLARKNFDVGLSALLLADEVLHHGKHHGILREIFGQRGIWPAWCFRQGRHGDLFLETMAS